ncbi:MAG: HXXEE domain-containing protein [Gemmatimonadetes bacterium]|nr:HXXEE domain-containing protein [Gemmatimonadota bacterium]
MVSSAPHGPSVAPRATLLLPVAYLFHLVEEWFGGFTSWTQSVSIYDVGDGEFLAINATAFILVALGTLAARREPKMAWVATSLAALFGLNALLHGLATVAWSSYAPGVITGILVYLPLSIVILRASFRQMSRGAFVGSVTFGVLLHGLVAVVASR